MQDSHIRKVSATAVFQFVWRYWKRMPGQFAAIVFGVFLAVLIELQIPAMSADLVVAVKQVLSDGASVDLAWTAMYWMLGTFVVLSIVQQFYLRIWMYFAAAVMHQMVSDGYSRVQRFSANWHADNFAGSTVRKITRGMWAYDSFADTVVINLGPGTCILTGFSIAMFLRDPWMGSYFTVSVAIYLAITVALSLLYVAPANRLSNDADTEVGGALADAITCNAVIKSFGAEIREENQINQTVFGWRKLARRAWTRSMDAGAVQSVMIVLMMAGLLSIVLTNVSDGNARLEDVVYVITTYFVVNGYLRNIGWQIRGLQRSINELDDLVMIEETMPQVADHEHAVALVAGPGEMRLDSVNFKYENQPVAVYQDFNLTIQPGEKVALVGESGAGKTTFVKLLQRLYDVNAGIITIDGQDISTLKQDSLRANIALVPQEPILFHRSLLENIAYARPGATFDEVISASKKAHAHDFVQELSEGYETLVGERGIKLSGGERQRVAIARAILADSPILILDEATSSLDSITEQMIQDAIATLMQGRTSILIAHRLSTIRQADRILVFDRGRIVETGTHAELMDIEHGKYRKLYDMQTQGFIGGGFKPESSELVES